MEHHSENKDVKDIPSGDITALSLAEMEMAGAGRSAGPAGPGRATLQELGMRELEETVRYFLKELDECACRIDADTPRRRERLSVIDDILYEECLRRYSACTDMQTSLLVLGLMSDLCDGRGNISIHPDREDFCFAEAERLGGL